MVFKCNTVANLHIHEYIHREEGGDRSSLNADQIDKGAADTDGLLLIAHRTLACLYTEAGLLLHKHNWPRKFSAPNDGEDDEGIIGSEDHSDATKNSRSRQLLYGRTTTMCYSTRLTTIPVSRPAISPASTTARPFHGTFNFGEPSKC